MITSSMRKHQLSMLEVCLLSPHPALLHSHPTVLLSWTISIIIPNADIDYGARHLVTATFVQRLSIDGPNLTPFLIPFTKVMHLIERRKLLDSFAKYSKLREL